MNQSNTCQDGAEAFKSSAPARKRGQVRRGNIIVLSAMLMIFVMAMAAFSVDVGYICLMQGELQRAVDAAALAGVSQLQYGVPEAKDKAKEYLVRNPVGSPVSAEEFVYAEALAEFNANHLPGLSMQAGTWDPGTRVFTESEDLPSTLKVSMEYPNLPFFFGRVLGQTQFKVRGEATASFQPRDILIVLDYSASMNDDSEFTAFAKLGQSEVEANLLEIYGDLGSPVYGNVPFTPTWVTVPGVPENVASQVPHVTVEYRYNKVYVTSTQPITTVRLEFSGGTPQNLAGSGTTGTFQGTGGNATRQITKVYVKSWNNHVVYPTYGEYFNFTSSGMNATLKKGLGLTSVAYPYPSGGSWDNYIDWVESGSTSNQNYNAGYRYKFGYMNWIVWMLENKPAYAQTPDLWKVRAEPMSALKSAVDVFMDFISAVDTNDRVGLAVYNGPDGEGKLEIALTDVYDPIVTSVNTKQAGHYHSYTNIGGGLHSGRLEIEANARPNASRMIILMTDGNANWVSGSYDEAAANAYVINEANECAENLIPIIAISLGAAADASIMQQAADITKGKHYNVPGGASQDDYYDQLYDVFEEIAAARPLRIVQ